MPNFILISKVRSLRLALRFIVVYLTATLAISPAVGQLAITEVQSEQFNDSQGADYWELTNFGDNPVDLSEYRFTEEGPFSFVLAPDHLAKLSGTNHIDPCESIIFARSKGVLTTPAEFRYWWWGESNLQADLKIAVTEWKFGFDQTKDAVQLWRVTPTETNLVDRVELFSSDRGNTFTYDSETGLLDRFSIAGVEGAFRAATSSDVGSPGKTTGLVPLRFEQVPASVELDGGMPVTLTALAFGLPRPHYQWLFNGQEIPGETATNFSIANVSAADAGQYSVKVTNGITNVITGTAILTVNTNRSCARIVRPPADLAVTPYQTVIFSVEVRGYPLPDISWEFNGQEIRNATNKTYVVTTSADASHVGTYTVRVANALCETNASARLDVVPPPNLIATEAMAWPSTNTRMPGHDDWWELTNEGTNEVNLRGYRFNDFGGTLTNAVVVTNDVIVKPGGSVILVSSMTPEAFKSWWGKTNLPEDLQIISYPGHGFNNSGDAIHLWNATAQEGDAWLFSCSVMDTNMFPSPGFSLQFDPILAACGIPSVEGEDGAFRASESDDIGSPGWISRPNIISIQLETTGIGLTWKTQPGRVYALQYSDTLAQPNWTTLYELPATDTTLSAMDTKSEVSQRFYRVVLLPFAP
jgi:hypothetical protein